MADANRPRKPVAAQKPPRTGHQADRCPARRQEIRRRENRARRRTFQGRREEVRRPQADPRDASGAGPKPQGRQAKSAADGRTGHRAAARSRQRRFDEIRRSADAADGLAAIEEQPLLRPGLRQSGVGQLLQRRHRRSARQPQPGKPAQQCRAARLPRQRIREAQLRHEVAASRNHQ